MNFSDDLHEPVFKTGKEAACGIIAGATTAHLQDVLRGAQGNEKAGPVGMRCCNWERRTRGRHQMPGVRPCQLKLALQIHLSDFHVEHSHSWGGVSKQFHNGGQADAGAEHFGGVRMAELMGDDAGADSDGGGYLV